MTDMINPAHYHGGREIEPIDVIEDWNLNYRLACALKYISRNGRKPGEDPREGLRKAIWYLEREIQSLDKPSQYKPAEYEDVLEYYGQSIDLDEAWPSKKETDYLNSIPGMRESILEGMATPSEELLSEQDLDEAWGPAEKLHIDLSGTGVLGTTSPEAKLHIDEDVWDDPWENSLDYITGWDDSLGPIEIEPEEIQERLAKKDLDQFAEDEIVSTIERRGMIIGFRKDGSSCLLKDGRCE